MSRSRPRGSAGNGVSCLGSIQALLRWKQPFPNSIITLMRSSSQEILSRIKDLGDKGMRVTDTDLMAVAEAVMAIENKPVLTMKQFTVVSGSNVIPTASVTLLVKDEEVTSAATGTGPVDAAMEALRKSVAAVADIVLEEYHVDAIHGGTDALVDVTVRLSKDGKIITSRGARTDIIMASVEAVVAGMNRLLREEHEDRSKNPD